MALLALNIWTDVDLIDWKGILIYKPHLFRSIRKKNYAEIFLNAVEPKKEFVVKLITCIKTLL